MATPLTGQGTTTMVPEEASTSLQASSGLQEKNGEGEGVEVGSMSGGNSGATSDAVALEKEQGKRESMTKDGVKEVIQVTTLLLSGQRKTFSFAKDSTILDVKQHVLDNWPTEWGGGAADRYPSGIDGIKLIWRGRVLENPTRLEDAGFKVHTNTIVHMPIQTIQDAAELEAEMSKKGGKRASGRHVYMPGARSADGPAESSGETSTSCCRCVIS